MTSTASKYLPRTRFTGLKSLNIDDGNRLQWDETNLTLHEIERENQEARMIIDEPKTPFVHGTSLGPVGDEYRR